MNTTCIPTDHKDMINRLFKGGDKLLPQIIDHDVTLLHAAIGIAGEAAELEKAVLPMRLDMAYKMAPMKRINDGVKHSQWDGYDGFSGVPVENITEELGDHLFYEGALRIATELEELPDEFRQPKLWTASSPLSRANQGQPRKLVLCELISLHSVIAGDILDVVKKRVMYRKELDRDKLTHLLVDDCWVVQGIADILGISENDIRTHNLNKLERGANARYKDGYSDQAAQDRADKKGEE
jgi:hypothetical protein